MIWITLIIIIALAPFGLFAATFKTFIGILTAIGIFLLRAESRWIKCLVA